MTKLRAASLVDLAKEEIERRIYSGEIADGARIVIDKLSRELGISAVPLREALARLHAQRLVKFEPNRGYAVLPPPTAAEMAELFDVRLALEVGALHLLDFPVPGPALDRLRQINLEIATTDYAESDAGYRAFARLNLRFHKAILELTGNRSLVRSYEDLGYHQLVTRVISAGGVDGIDLIAAQHDAIIDALAEPQSDTARRALITHIASGRDRFVAGYAAGERPRTDGAAPTP